MVNAPDDDEPFTEEDRKAVEEAERDLGAGHGIPHSEILARYGLNDEDPDEPRRAFRGMRRADGAMACRVPDGRP